MTTYRVIGVEKNNKGDIARLTVRTDTGRRLKNKEVLTMETVKKWIDEYGDVFYKIDLATGKTGIVRQDGAYISTIGDKDLADNLE